MGEVIAYVWGLPLVCHLTLSLVLWAFALGLLIVRRTRSLGKHLALAVAGTFPVSWGFHLLSFPIVVGVVLLASLFSSQSGIAETLCIAVVWVSVVAVSVIGFVVGWRTGWRCADGLPVRAAVAMDPILGRIMAWLLRVSLTVARRLGYPDR